MMIKFGVWKYLLILNNLKSYCGKKTLSTELGFEPRCFDCRSTALTTELHRKKCVLNKVGVITWPLLLEKDIIF